MSKRKTTEEIDIKTFFDSITDENNNIILDNVLIKDRQICIRYSK